MNPIVLVTGRSVPTRYLDRLRHAGFEVRNPSGLLTEPELRAELLPCSAYLLGGDEYATRDCLDGAKRLQVISFLGVGYESFLDVKAATENGIKVTNTPGTLTNSVAEFTFAHLLALRRRIVPLNNQMKHGLTTSLDVKANDLTERKLGIVGLGAIGSEVARRAVGGFRMEVSYFSRTRKASLEEELGISFVKLEDLLAESDIIVLMVPGNDSTRGMIGQRQFGTMKQSALLINTARPEVVDPRALFEALDSGVIAGAAFDGYYVDPLPPTEEDKYGLLSLPDDKFLVTPHVASLTHDARDRMSDKAVTSILNILAGKPDENIVNARE